MPATVYLVRHATPDWSRTDLRYDIPPGPPLTAQGEAEAMKLGEFLAAAGVVRLYASPLDRATRTAQLAADAAKIPVMADEEIAEWRRGEPENEVLDRCRLRVESALDESLEHGPVALVTHGGPIRALLTALGLDKAEIDFYRRQFDRDNPLPPAGVWRITRAGDGSLERPELVFTPQPYTSYVPAVVYV